MRGVFEALSELPRRQILEFLAAGEQSAGGVVAALQARAPISQPAVSQHLKVLREARLVIVRASGRRRFYAIDEAGLSTAHAWLASIADPLGPFGHALDALATEVTRGRRARRLTLGAAGAQKPSDAPRTAAAG